jgi:hyaluronoglucosaminidase
MPDTAQTEPTTLSSGEDRPYWGYLEGYYGRLLGWDDRNFLLSTIAAESLNTYFYAPKEDPLHRIQWRTPYPRAWIRQFEGFVAAASEKRIRVIPGLAPGLSFDYGSALDYRRLKEKFRRFLDAGAPTVCLLMDDIPVTTPASCIKKRVSLGHAHGDLLARLASDLSAHDADSRLLFCPTVYCDQLSEEGVEAIRSPYLIDLQRAMPSPIPLMWTGPHIVSTTLTPRVVGPLCRLFSGNVVIWDNLYANDYCCGKIFGGPYTGRSFGLLDTTRGVLLNPTGLPLTDAFLLSLLGAFSRRIPAHKAWRDAAANHGLPAELVSVVEFFSSPFTQPAAAPPGSARHRRLRKTVEWLVFSWKGPLHREWYPFLYQLRCDLMLAQNRDDSAWIAKKYSAITARLLLDK